VKEWKSLGKCLDAEFAKNMEDAEKRNPRMKRRGIVALRRKSPPFLRKAQKGWSVLRFIS